MNESRADSFLRLIRKAQRGRLKIYLGYCAGVGKTYQMLEEAHRLKAEGIDVVIGFVETHGRKETAALLEGLEILERRKITYRGILIEELDVDAVLARLPAVALVDELAHSNVPGSKHAKRYQDIEELLAAGIHVVTTLNVQHLESLYDTVEKNLHVKVRERLPDKVIHEADQIVNVDLTAEDLLKRLKEGKIYPPERVTTALSHFFIDANLEQLRELTLRELATHIDQRRRDEPVDGLAPAPDQVMVCLSSKGPSSEMLLRYASRLAGKLNRTWYAVYVQRSAERPDVIDSRTQRILSNALTLAKQLGAMVFTYKGEDVAKTVLQFAREYRVGHIIVGAPGKKMPVWRRWLGEKSIVERLVDGAEGNTIVVVDTGRSDQPDESASHPPPGNTEMSDGKTPDGFTLGEAMALHRISILDEPVDKWYVIKKLITMSSPDIPGIEPEALLSAVVSRENQGSTFFNEGVAFPHAKIESVKRPIVALLVSQAGVQDTDSGIIVQMVFLIFTALDEPRQQVKILGLINRFLQDNINVQRILSSKSEREILQVLTDN